MNEQINLATFGAGCFWCVEGIFQRVEGVEKVVPGYAGGLVLNPTYEEVCSGATGHAEVAQITFNPEKVTFEALLEVFWKTHDPTTLNRQGNDVGTQYRSAIFYHNETQANLARSYKAQLNSSGNFNKPIVTEIVPINNYFEAEEYHHNYFNQNGEKGYCQLVIQPKIDKFNKEFANKLKA